MAGTDNQVLLSDISNALKEDYEPVLQKTMFDKNVLATTLRKNAGVNSATNEERIIFHNNAHSAGVGAISAGKILPAAGNQDFDKSTVNMKWIYGFLSLDDTTIEATKSNKAAAISMLDSEMQSLKDAMARDESRQMYGLGDGTIALVDGASSDTTVVLKTPTSGPVPTHYLQAGQYLYMEDGTTAAGSGNVRKIVSVDSDTQITVDSNVTVADNDKVALAQKRGTTYETSHNLGSTDKEIMGLQGIVDDGTNKAALQGITRSSNTWFNGWVGGNSGTPRVISTALLNELTRNVSKYGNPTLIITTPQIYDAYGEILESDKRFVNEMELKGGFTAISFKNSKIVQDWDCPINTVFAIDPTAISVEEMAPVSWMDRDGAILSRNTDTASYNATLRHYLNLGALNPRKTGRLDDISHSAS